MSGDGRRRTRLSATRESLYDRIEPHGRTETVRVEAADGRVAAASVVAPNPVPETPRAAVDGYAVRAADAFGASDRSPAVLRVDASVERGTATRVAAGEPVPAAADAVVPSDAVDRLGDELELFEAVPENGNVTPAGSLIAADEHLVTAGERIRPTTLGLLGVAGVERVTVGDRPVVVVLGDAPGAVVAATCARRWGARAVVREVASSRRPLRMAIGRTDAASDRSDGATDETAIEETADVIHVVGRTGEGREIGRRLARRLAVAPGGETSLAVADGRPVITSPGDPVETLVGAVGLVRPAIRALDGRAPAAPPGRRARLSRKLRSAPGVRTFVPVTVTEHTANGEQNASEASGSTDENRPDEEAERANDDRDAAGVGAVASPLEATGAATASHASRADGWVAVSESREGIDAGEVVMVRDWEVGA